MKASDKCMNRIFLQQFKNKALTTIFNFSQLAQAVDFERDKDVISTSSFNHCGSFLQRKGLRISRETSDDSSLHFLYDQKEQFRFLSLLRSLISSIELWRFISNPPGSARKVHLTRPRDLNDVFNFEIR